MVNLRLGDEAAHRPGVVAEAYGVLADLAGQGLVRHLGISNATTDQIAEARTVAPVVCVQNRYNLAHREDDDLVDACAADGTVYVPFFPLGGFSPVQSGALDDVAARLGATALQVALAWLLHRSPAIALIPGTSSVEHLRDNAAAADLVLDDDALHALDQVGR